jgi:hypothetical protein
MEGFQQGENALSILRTYSPTHRVALSDAKQDQIRLEVGDWRLVAPEHFAFFRALCAPTGRAGLSFTGAGSRRPLQIRKGGRGAGERVGGPLFTGEVRHWRVGKDDDFSIDQYGLRLSLSLNPTRYVAHQQSRSFAGLPVAEWSLPEPAMYRRRTVRGTRLETILDDNDNVLLTGAAQAHGQPAAWPTHLQRYWGGVTAEIDAAFADAAVRSGSMVQRVAENLNLRLVETYWEFAARDPTALVMELEVPLFELGGSAEARTFDYEHGERIAGRHHNARSVQVRLKPGVSLRVYAKTTGRVRFEITHDLQKLAPARYVLHTGTNDADLFGWLDTLAADAACEVNAALEHIEGHTFFPPNSLRPYNLIRRIGEALPDGAAVDAALSLIVNNRAIRLAPGDPLRPMVKALVRYEVLVPRDRSTFVIAPLFREAVMEMRGQRRGIRRSD